MHVDIDKEVIGSGKKEPTLALLPNKVEQEENNKNGQTGVANDNRNH